MELHQLKPAKGAVKKAKNPLGRGEGSQSGSTSTRGYKGAKSRSGYSRKIGFEGGQQPLQRRVPKFGFTSPNRVQYKGVNLEKLQQLVDAKKIKNNVDIQALIDNGIVGKSDRVKILAGGTLNVKLDISAHAFSASAKAIIEQAGGSVIVIN